jgi:two-component system NtrC family sensor kinase
LIEAGRAVPAAPFFMSDLKKVGGSDSAPPHRTPEPRQGVASRFEQFERRQNELWRLTFVLLFIISVGFAIVSWDAIRALPHRFEALVFGLVVLVVLFIAYAWQRNREASDLRGLVRGIEQRDAASPSDKQLDQLFEIIARSQQGYRDLIDSFDDILLALSLEGEIRAVNRSFSDLVSTPFQQIIGKPLSDFIEEATGEGNELIQHAMPRFLERHHWSGVVQVHLKGKNSVYYFDCVAHAMTRADKVHGITVLARDITALRKNEARFTELFESLQEGIYIATPDGSILDANPALVRMLGYDSKAELLAKNVEEILVDRMQRKSLKAQVEQQSMVQGREVTLIRKDGSSIVCLNTSTVVRDASGNVVRYQGAIMDITERREMERRLHQQQEFARRLIASFPDLIFVLDTAARYTFISPSIKEVLGFEPEEAPDLQLGDRTHSEDRPALRSLFNEILAGRQSFASLEVRVRHKNGEWRRIRCHFSPLFDEQGKIEGVVISGRDVTEVKRLEEQLIQAEKLAAMGQMLAGVAHELNNPLTAVLGVTEVLRDKQIPDEAIRRQLELTHRQARRAARIVQNLLEFSRPASPQKKPLDLNSLIERTLQLHEHSLRRNNIAVEFRPQPGLPGVVGDGNQLIQVFLNLVTNAEQAIREVRDTGRIQIRLAQGNGRLSVTVQDDGIGLKPETIPRLFDPFYTTKRPGGGTGLGLSICMSIVREHGGNIEAQALPAGGSAFVVYLPAASGGPVSAPPDPRLAQPAIANLARGDSRDQHSLKNLSVLVLDDEESIRMLLEEGLSAHGLRVNTAHTLAQAVALASKDSYDVLLCDLNLSDNGSRVSGQDAAAQILSAAAHSAKPLVVFMTGDFIEASEAESRTGGYRVLQKPFRIADVLALLRGIVPLDGHGAAS